MAKKLFDAAVYLVGGTTIKVLGVSGEEDGDRVKFTNPDTGEATYFPLINILYWTELPRKP